METGIGIIKTIRRFAFWLIVPGGLCLFAGNSAGEEVPVLFAEKEIVASDHLIPREVGTSIFPGQLDVSESLIASYEAWDPERESLEGRVRLLDRVTLDEVAVVPLSVFQVENGSGFGIGVSDDQLAVVHQGGESIAPKFGLYRTGGEGVEQVALRDLEFESGDGLGVRPEGGNWILWNSDWTLLLSGSDGSELGRWPVEFGERVGEWWFLSRGQGEDLGSGEEGYHLVDLRESGTVLDLAIVPGLREGERPASVDALGGRLLIREFFTDGDGVWETTLSVFDPPSDAILWREELPGYGRDPVVSGGLWFGRITDNDLEVRRWDDGVIVGTIEKPEAVTDSSFGYRAQVVDGVIYVSGGQNWYAYDRQTLAFQRSIDTGDEPAGGALIQSIPGSRYLAWIYNDGRVPVILHDSYFWNPQVLLFDPAIGMFVGKIDPEDSIGRSTGGLGDTFPSPGKFGIEFFAMPDGRIAMSSSHLTEGGRKYQVFDPELRIDPPRPELTARLLFEERAGFEVHLEKQEPGGGVEVLFSTDFGQGREQIVDVDPLSWENELRYVLKESQKLRVSDEYEMILDTIPDLTERREGRVILLAPAAHAVVHASYESGIHPEGKVTVLNDDGTVRFELGPRRRRFGTVMATEGRTLAVGTDGTYWADSITLFDLVTGDEKASLPAANSFAISGEVIVGYFDGELIGHRVSDGQEIFRTVVDYTLPFPSLRPRIHCGAGVVVFDDKVYDLATGKFRFELIYPDSEPEDYFGVQVASDGNLIAAISTRRAKGYLFDATSGEVVRSFGVDDLPEGFLNYASRYPRLAMDVEADVIAWAINDSTAGRAVNLFRVSTGKRFGQIRGKEEIGGVIGGPEIRSNQLIGAGIELHSSRLWLVTGSGAEEGLAVHDLVGFDTLPLEVSETEIHPNKYLKLHFRGRRGVNYQAFSGPLDGLVKTGGLLPGTGGEQCVLLPVPPNVNRWFGSIEPEWAPAPTIFPF